MTDKLHQYQDTEMEAAERVQENVSNLPITSIALAFLLGAGLTALVSLFGLHRGTHVSG